MSESNLFLVEAYNRGFRVSDCGKFIKTARNKRPQVAFEKGYPIINVRIGKKTMKVPWHRIQAMQKYGEELFKEGIVVRHKNSIKTDCSTGNILIGTMADNNMDKPAEDRLKYALNAASYIRKYQASEVKEFYSQNKSYKKTMEKFGISSKGTLHFILNNTKHS
jgi:hypothetical protein